MNILSAVVIGSDNGVVGQLLTFLLIGICVALIWWVGTWFIRRFKMPDVATIIWTGIFLLVGLLFMVNFLMGLAGRPMFRW